MSIGLFTDEVISNPHNAGEMEDDLIKDASFKICGCVATLASASVTTVRVKGYSYA